MDSNYSQKDIERGYLRSRRLTPSSFLELLCAIDVPKLLNHLWLLEWHTTSNIRWRKQYYIFCPFHQERSPSCWIDTEKWFFYCFWCHEKWDLVKFTILVQWKWSLHAMGTLRNLFRVKGLEYETVETPIPEVLNNAKYLILHIIDQLAHREKNQYYTEIQSLWYLSSYVEDFLIYNKLKQLYTISQFASNVMWVPSWKRDYRGYAVTREFLEYVDARRSWEAWEDFLFENYEEAFNINYEPEIYV